MLYFLILKKEFAPVTTEEVAAGLNLSLSEIEKEAACPNTWFNAYRAPQGTILINTRCDQVLRNKIIRIVAEHHEKNPLFPDGPDTGEIGGKLGLQGTTAGKIYLDKILEVMMQDQQLELFRGTWIIRGHKPIIDQQSQREIAWLEEEIKGYGEHKPVLAEIEERAALQRIPKHKIRTCLSWLASNGRIRFHKSEFIHTDILSNHQRLLVDYLKTRSNGAGIGEIKELMNVTRRLRAFILDILETEKVISIETGSETETRIFLNDTGRP